MKYSIELDDDTADGLVRAIILDSMKVIEQVCNPEDVPLWDAMNMVLANYCAPTHMQELEQRMIPSEWIKTVLQHDKEKPDAYHLYSG